MDGTGPADSALMQLLPFALILVVFYFLLIRPQQQKAKETQAMLENSLRPRASVALVGVVTASGVDTCGSVRTKVST